MPSFDTALSGLNAASSDLDVTANNIANANTAGFKGSRAEFADVFSSTGAGASSNAIGQGVRLATVAQQFQQGNIENTQNSLDFAISGNGFFTVAGNNGIAYTRAGAFHKDKDGFVVNDNNQRLQVFAPNSSGKFNTSDLQDLQLGAAQATAQATSAVQLAFNLPAAATQPATAPFSPADPSSFNEATPFTVYDSQGSQHDATAYYVKTATPNQWQLQLTVAGQAAGNDTITFSPNGTLTAPANGQLTFNPITTTPGTNPIALTLDVSKATQFGTGFSIGQINQNGYPPGKLTAVGVSQGGVVSARFSNGQSKTLGQVAMAKFSDPEALSQLTNTQWAASFDSGEPVYGAPGGSGFGSIQSSALEASNTADLTAQLVNMIKAQRNYQANAKVISTGEKTMQTILNAVQ
jgi:flagellar hook protein FlgE